MKRRLDLREELWTLLEPRGVVICNDSLGSVHRCSPTRHDIEELYGICRNWTMHRAAVDLRRVLTQPGETRPAGGCALGDEGVMPNSGQEPKLCIRNPRRPSAKLTLEVNPDLPRET